MDDAQHEIDALINALAASNGITLNEEMMPQIRIHYEIASRMAKALLEFPLDDHEEPAPVFTA